MEFSCDSVIESCSDGKEYITVAYCHICSISTMHTKVSDIKRMVSRNGTFAHYGCDNRYFCFFYYFPEDFVGAGDYYTAACKE